MNSQKIENLLNLSLDSTKEEREKSQILEVGYDPFKQTWEVIVKYHGAIENLADDVIKVEILLNGYAIVTIPEILIDSLSALEEIEYIEKPKNLSYAVYGAKKSSCILPLTTGNSMLSKNLSGRGTLVAVLDSGIDYFLPDFQNESGSRILCLWDQTLEENEEKGFRHPVGFETGVEFNKEMIDRALAAGSREEALKIVPQQDVTGHGTAVTGIAAGSASGLLHRGIAAQADLLIVKLGMPAKQGFPRTTELMRAMTYVLQKAELLQKPLVVNLSFGNTYGAHDGTSILERFMDNASEVNRTVVCVGSGNEAASGGHVSGQCKEKKRIELSIGRYERSINVQLWKNYVDEIKLEVIAPNGSTYRVAADQIGKQVWTIMETTILIYVGTPTPYSVNQEIFFDFIPKAEFIASGIWTFVMSPVKIVNGTYQMYLPSDSVRSDDTQFFSPSPDLTLTIPSTSRKVITVGAYNSIYNAYADFSGRGQNVPSEISIANPEYKPDLVAPGVRLLAPVPGGTYAEVTGTSFSTPVVSGSVALMMEWGIVQGNDPYLYGEKVKAYLMRGAKPLPGFSKYPDSQIGWGALCVKDSLPI